MYLLELELVDSVEGLNLIDILIGLDYYWDFVIGEFICGDFGFIVVKSKLGWFFFGLIKNL